MTFLNSWPISYMGRRGGASVPFETAGALSRKNAGQTISTGFTAVTWQEDVYDITNWHNVSSNTARMTVPTGAGIEAVRMVANVRPSGNINYTTRFTQSLSGGAVAVFDGAARHHAISPSGSLGHDDSNICSAIIETNDASTPYFQYEFAKSSGTTTPTNHGNTFFTIEAIDPSLRRVLAKKTSTQAFAANVAEEITWDTTVYNEGSWTVSAENITVPFTGRIRVTANVNYSVSGNNMSLRLFKNGATTPGSFRKNVGDLGGDYINVVSAVLEVTSGDEISIEGICTANGNVNNNEHTWICIEEVPSDYVCVLLHRNSGTQSITSTASAITWQVAAYEDDSSLWDAGAPTLVIAPFDGYFRQTIGFVGASATLQVCAWGEQDGAIYYGSPSMSYGLGGVTRINAMGAWAPCSAGDEIRMMAQSSTTRNIATDNETFMCVEFKQ